MCPVSRDKKGLARGVPPCPVGNPTGQNPPLSAQGGNGYEITKTLEKNIDEQTEICKDAIDEQTEMQVEKVEKQLEDLKEAHTESEKE